MSDDELRNRYRARPERLADGPHPEAKALDRAARRAGPAAKPLAVIDHVMQCPSCRPEFELLRAIAAADRSEQPQ